MTVDLNKDEWDRILAIIGKAPWDVANPLLMRIGQQLQSQYERMAAAPSSQYDTPSRSGDIDIRGVRMGNSGQ